MVAEYPELNGCIKFNTNLSVLDSILIDFNNTPISELPNTIKNILDTLDNRMFKMLVSEKERCIVISKNHTHNIIHFYEDEEKIVIDDFCPDDTIFIITKTIDDREIIHPPYLEDIGDNQTSDYPNIMSWLEFYKRIAKGEELHLVFECPYLQGKIFNIGVSDEKYE